MTDHGGGGARRGLTVTGIRKQFVAGDEATVVLADVSLSVAPGESVVITGPSGCGKSTLLAILGTLESPTDGRLEVDGVDPFSMVGGALARFRNERIGFVFQDHHLLPQCTVLENVLIPAFARRQESDRTPRAIELLERVGLGDRLHHFPAQISGGQRQRAAVARALINQPTVILADEPTGNLDRASAANVADLLLELAAVHDAALIVATHSAALVNRFRRRGELVDGRLTFDDPPDTRACT